MISQDTAENVRYHYFIEQYIVTYYFTVSIHDIQH